MRRLRTRVTAIFLLVAGSGIAGTMLVTARTFVTDKRDYVTEVNSIAAPNVAAAIGRKLDFLEQGLQVFDQILQTSKHSLERLGVERLEVHPALAHGSKPVFFGRATRDEELPIALRVMEALTRSGERIVLGAGEVLLVGMVIHGSRYLIWLKADLFKENFELARALAVSLVDEDGSIMLGGFGRGIHLPKAALETLHKALSSREKQAVLARELDVNGHSVLAAIAPIPNTRGIAVVVLAPAAEIWQLAGQAIKNAIPFIIIVLALTVLMGVLFSRQLVHPIEELTAATEKIAVGNWRISFKRAPNNEIGLLVQSFSKMGEELEDREEALHQATAELVRSERLAALGRFSAGIAHEVKNPLNSILGYAQLLQRKPDSENTTKFMGFITDECRRASRIISDLLTFARQKPPQRLRRRLMETIDRACELGAPQAAAAQVEIHKEIVNGDGGSNLEAEIDADQIQQVLSNLMINAIQALEEKSEGPRILTLRLFKEDALAMIEVSDTGCGIPEDNLLRLFEPFFSTKASGKGTGLGLSLCLGIVEQHGGKITVSSKANEGTTFKIALPLASTG